MSTESFAYRKEVGNESPTNSIRTLGVHINPAFAYSGQFEVMRKKLYISIARLMNANVNLFQAAIYWNTYMNKSVHFRCGTLELIKK